MTTPWPFDDMPREQQDAMGMMMEAMPMLRSVAVTTAKVLIANGGLASGAILDLRQVDAVTDTSDAAFDVVELMVQAIEQADREVQEVRRGG